MCAVPVSSRDSRAMQSIDDPTHQQQRSGPLRSTRLAPANVASAAGAAANKENRPAAVAITGAPPSAAAANKLPAANKKPGLPVAPATIVDAYGEEFVSGRVLGQGGFARVYDATSAQGEHFAFKIIDKASVLSSKRNRAKLLAEMKIHKSMKHPHIVNFLDEFEDQDNVYFKLELCAHGSINDMIKKRGRFIEEESRYFMIQLLTACQHMHLSSVLHRDLKLGNIMLDADMQLKIGDFGLAALLAHPAERKRTVCGTPNYIAPEILYDQGQGHSYEADIWSVGVIMYTLVVGKPPFQTNNVQQIYERIKHNEYEIPADCPVSSEVRELIANILQPNPNYRPTLIEIMNHPWITLGSVPRNLPSTSCMTMAVLPRISPQQSQSNAQYLQEIGRWVPDADDELPEDVEDVQMSKAEEEEEDYRSRLSSMIDIENQRAQVNSEAEKAVNPQAPISDLLQAGQPLQKVPPSAGGPSSRTPTSRRTAPPLATARPPFTARIVDHLGAALAAYEAGVEVPMPLPQEALYSSMALGTATEPGLVEVSQPDGTVRRSPPAPQAFILSWLDASDRYGLGYALSNGSIGVHFRDGSSNVLSATRGVFEYVCPTRRSRLVSSTVAAADAETQLESDLLRRKEYPLPRDAHGQLFMHATSEAQAVELRTAAQAYLSRDMTNKLEILMYFQAEITHRLCGADHPLLRPPAPGAEPLPMPFVHRWFRATSAIVFVFSNDLVQMNFYADHIKVLLSHRGSVVSAIVPNEDPLAGADDEHPVHLFYTWRLDQLLALTSRDRSQQEASALAQALEAIVECPALTLAELVKINITSPEERRAARRVWRKLPICREVLARSSGLEA